MMDEIKSHWNGRAEEYDKNVRQVIYSERDRISWQKIFVQALGGEKLKILDVGTARESSQSSFRSRSRCYGS